MMSTYELVIAFLSTPDTSTSSTIEITTVQRKKIELDHVDAEANAINESEL